MLDCGLSDISLILKKWEEIRQFTCGYIYYNLYVTLYIADQENVGGSSQKIMNFFMQIACITLA